MVARACPGRGFSCPTWEGGSVTESTSTACTRPRRETMPPLKSDVWTWDTLIHILIIIALAIVAR
ncbi:hypothetical protein GUG52_00635, partial [Xanthomonas citri pv. citri]|nr:hypothetical protein [Xanthomonas citri pv. citri]